MWEDSAAEELLWEELAELVLWEQRILLLWEGVSLVTMDLVLEELLLEGLALWEQCTLLLLEEVLSVDTGLQEDSVLDVSELVVLELDVLVVSLVAMG